MLTSFINCIHQCITVLCTSANFRYRGDDQLHARVTLISSLFEYIIRRHSFGVGEDNVKWFVVFCRNYRQRFSCRSCLLVGRKQRDAEISSEWDHHFIVSYFACELTLHVLMRADRFNPLNSMWSTYMNWLSFTSEGTTLLIERQIYWTSSQRILTIIGPPSKVFFPQVQLNL